MTGRSVHGNGAATSISAIVGQSEVMREAIAQAERFALSRLPILLVGATGTGKELFARHIHRTSARRGDFVDVNCGALPRDMVESLLFGHRRGAFTGAVSDMPGLVTRASAGTLFLDELCSLTSEAQVKLLRVLESGEVRALGATRNSPVEFRLVSAVQEEFGARIEGGAFREDLYHRVAGVVLRIPRLSERPGDVVMLAAHFAAAYGRILGSGAAAVLEQHAWPGNVRELRTVIGRAAVLTDREALDAASLTDALCQGAFLQLTPGSTTNGGHKRMALLAVCLTNGWDALRISAALGVSRATLYRRLKDEGICLRTSGRHLRPHRTRSSHASH